ncbi:MAG: nitroreductase family protein [Ignavibacteria bacterium]|nr:nitroreductase family protein [Ignavibacteria bacterium]
MDEAKLVALNFVELPESEMLTRANTYNSELQKRRTVRDFSNKPVSIEIIKTCLLAAGSAPSGANKQPWKFVVVTDPMLKTKIRYAAELVEQEFYEEKAPKEWINALTPLGTDKHKPFLEEAPVLIVIFEEKFAVLSNGEKSKNYYTHESVGIATGILISAIHKSGLVSLTHTPSPMSFLNKILDRPATERPFLILVVGYPKEGACVPAIKRKPLEEVAIIK